jgi:hypothetical protein
MTQKITITVPDDIHGRLQAVKDAINVSGVCQGAIIKAVEYEELKGKEMPKMEKLVERLKMEKSEGEEEWKKIGLEDGREHAPVWLSYAQFKAIAKRYRETGGFGQLANYQAQEYRLVCEANQSRNRNTGDYLTVEIIGNVISDEVQWLRERMSELSYDGDPVDEEAYLTGWLEGVMSIWNQVEAEL